MGASGVQAGCKRGASALETGQALGEIDFNHRINRHWINRSEILGEDRIDPINYG